MKKIFLTAIVIISGTIAAMAGGILTNTNQTVHFLRNPARGASLEIDGVYTNPAGLIFLNEGFHLTLNNQSAFQTRTITSTFAPFAEFGGNATKEYVGEAKAWSIPSVMAAYRMGNFAFSGSFSIVGGGGTAVFDKGLPSFEAPISMLPLLLSANGVATDKYSVDAYMEGSSIIFGGQIGATYKINELISCYAGIRLNIVNNGYVGHLKNISVNPRHPLNPNPGELMLASIFFTSAMQAAQGVAGSLQSIIDSNYGGYTLGQLAGAGQLSQDRINQLAAGLGVIPDAIRGMTVIEVQEAYNDAAAANQANAEATADKNLETKQSGMGFAPVLGLNFNYENFNLGIKYEFISKLEVENDTKIDQTGMFPDKAKTYHDIPALLTIGASYKIIEPLTFSCGYHHFFEKDARMGNDRQKTLDGGTNEILAGIEYRINPMFLVSCGMQMTRSGATDAYQQDLSYSLKSNSYGIGGTVFVTENIKVNLAYFLTDYTDWTKDNIANYNNTGMVGKEVFSRTSQAFGIGIDFHF